MFLTVQEGYTTENSWLSELLQLTWSEPGCLIGSMIVMLILTLKRDRNLCRIRVLVRLARKSGCELC